MTSFSVSMGGSLVFDVAVMMTTASASSGLASVVLGSDNYFFCQIALVIPSVDYDVIFGGGNDNNRVGESLVASAILLINALPFCSNSRCLAAFFINILCG